MVKRLETGAGVPDPTGAADQHPTSFPIVGAGYATVRVGTHRSRHRCKPKTDKQERDEQSCSGRTHWISVGWVKRCDCFWGYLFHKGYSADLILDLAAAGFSDC